MNRNDNFLIGFHEERTEEPWDHPIVAYWKDLGASVATAAG